MRQRVIIIAETKADGARRAAMMNNPEVVAIVTPRSPNGARSQLADRIVVTPSMRDHPALAELRASAEPALATVLEQDWLHGGAS